MELLLTPVVSEKAMTLVEAEQTYIFTVPKTANKITVAQAISKRYGVKVISVNISNQLGKPKRLLINRGRKVLHGKRAATKKAYVRLDKGQSIPLFEGAKK